MEFVAAIENQDRPMIQVLLKGGADPDLKDGQGRSSREWAQRFQIPEETFGETKKSL